MSCLFVDPFSYAFMAYMVSEAEQGQRILSSKDTSPQKPKWNHDEDDNLVLDIPRWWRHFAGEAFWNITPFY